VSFVDLLLWLHKNILDDNFLLPKCSAFSMTCTNTTLYSNLNIKLLIGALEA